jgi:dTDP-4-dehydrorhamnose 3,5-epimerase
MSRFVVENTSIEGLQIIQRQPIGDARGYLERLFCVEELTILIDSRRVMQINHTLTANAGTIRGMHFQYPPHAEMKLVSCLRGEVFDVAVDLRKDSPTFLQWHAEVLSEDNHRTFCIPEGFAHGFQTLKEDCELIYLHTAAYAPKAESALNALDPMLKIAWPMPTTELASRDQNHSMITSNFSGLSI